MGWTKLQHVEHAFAEIGLAPDVFNVAPEQLQRALRSLDAMMATWNAKGIRLGYPLPSSPDDSVLDQDSGIPDAANETVALNLAIRIAPGVGKQVSPDTKASAKAGYDVLLARAAFPPQQPLKTLPSGAGNKPSRTYQPFLPPTPDPLLAAEGGDQIEFE